MAALVDAARSPARHGRSRAELPRPAVRRRSAPPYDVVVAGAGFAGSVLAERLAAGLGQAGARLRHARPHVAGNAYDCHDAAGILVHRYGPHIFHTNSDEVVDYLSRFTEWRPYEHRVLADLGDRRLPMPINRTTLAALFGRPLPDDAAAARLLAELAEPVPEIRNARDVVVSAVGRRLYETFFEGYTRKQWGLDPSELDKSVTARVPARSSLDDRYFLDSFQAMPREGYTRMFERMLDHALHRRRARHRLPRSGARAAGAADDLHRADRRLLRPSVRRICPIAASSSATRRTTAGGSRRSASSTIPMLACPTPGSPSTST